MTAKKSLPYQDAVQFVSQQSAIYELVTESNESLMTLGEAKKIFEFFSRAANFVEVAFRAIVLTSDPYSHVHEEYISRQSFRLLHTVVALLGTIASAAFSTADSFDADTPIPHVPAVIKALKKQHPEIELRGSFDEPMDNSVSLLAFTCALVRNLPPFGAAPCRPRTLGKLVLQPPPTSYTAKTVSGVRTVVLLGKDPLLEVLLDAAGATGAAMKKFTRSGCSHIAVLMSDGTVVEAGPTGSQTVSAGNLGDNATPLDATDIAVGDAHVAVVLQDGGCWSWGSNEWGQMGNGSVSTLAAAPVKAVLRAAGHIAAVAAGSRHTLVVNTAGIVYGWGACGAGQLGPSRGTAKGIVTTPSPVWCSVSPDWKIYGKAVLISACGDYSAVLTTSGTALLTGLQLGGLLGKKSSGPSHSFSPLATPPGAAPIVNVVASTYNVALLLADGAVLVAGCNSHGQVGLRAATSSVPALRQLPLLQWSDSEASEPASLLVCGDTFTAACSERNVFVSGRLGCVLRAIISLQYLDV